MASNEIKVKIKVDDDGSLSLVQKKSKGAADAIDKVGSATEQTGKSAKTADRNLKGLSRQSANTTKNFSKMQQGMTGGLVPAYAILASNVFAITAAFQFLKKAADFRVMQESQVAFTGATGVGMQSLTANIQAASGAMLDFQSASEAASIGIASGLSSGQLEGLAEGAGNLSKILGRDVTDSFNRLVRGVTKAEPELLDELGITLRLADAQENYAATLGKSAKDLTTYEKKQAVHAEVQGQLEAKYNAVAKATGVQANAVARLGVAFDRIMKKVKEFTAKIAEPTAEFFTKNIVSLTAALALLAIPIIRSILPGMEDWKKKSKEAAEEASNAYREAKEELEELDQQQKDMAAGKPVTAGIKDPSKGLQRTGGDISKLKKAEAAALLRHANKTNKKLEHMDRRQLSTYRIHLKARLKGAYSTWDKIVLGYNNMGSRMDIANKKMVASWRAAMAGMQAATAKMTRGVDLLFKGMGLVGVALMLKDLLKEAAIYLGLIAENKELVKLLAQYDGFRESVEQLNEEYKDFAKIQQTLKDAAAENPKVMHDSYNALKAEGEMVASLTKNILAANDALTDMRGKVAAAFNVKEFVDISKQMSAAEVALGKARDDPNWKQNKTDIPLGGGTHLGNYEYVGPLKGQAREDEIARFKAIEDAAMQASTRLSNANESVKQLTTKTKELMDVNKLAADKALLHYGNIAQGDLTKNQQSYIALLEILSKEGKLTKEDAKTFKELGDSIEKVGSKAALTAQEVSAYGTSYNKVISGLTKHKTANSDLITDLEKLETKLKGMAQTELVAKDLDDIQEYLRVLNKVRQMELDLANNKLILQTAFTKARSGATPLQMEELARAEKMTDNNLKILDIQNQINFAKAELKGMDPELENNLLNQVEHIKAQNAELERQGQLRALLVEDMKTGFETGLQKGISDVLKGDANIKEALAGMAKGIVDTMIDSVAKSITQDIMNAMNMQTEEQRAAEAMRIKVEEGIKNGTLVLDEKLKTSTAPAIATEVKESVVAAGEAVKTAMTEGATELTIALDETITRLADAIREACASCVCKPGEGGGTGTGTGTGDGSWWTDRTGGGVGQNGSTPALDPVTGEAKPAAGGMDQLQEVEVTAQRREDDLSGGTTAGDEKSPVAKLNDTMKESNKITMKEVAGLGMAVTALLGNSKAGQALQKIMAAFYLFEMGKTIWEKGKLLWEKLFGAKELVSESANTAALTALTTVVAADVATGPLSKTGLYPPLGYAGGGIAKGPMSGYPAVLHGNEAVVPLPNGKDIPVTFPRGGGPGAGQTNHVGVTVNIDSEGGVDTTTESDAQEAQELGERVAFAVQQELLNQKRAGGMLSPYGVA